MQKIKYFDHHRVIRILFNTEISLINLNNVTINNNVSILNSS